ncbi:hypothetical protein [Microbacterium sp. W4I20]|uniref:hypothetical protein n=1 Tax=Microbacterium sp. W4I20 TaxID=3042262 RepID=UPI00278A8438|nr:hypothetical protein [Microbacterium sp. W4I20]MDQ0726793.1 hypothetical protein [Microbacterium sp. W4I20]
MSVHDDARAAFEAVYDTELERLRELLLVADGALDVARTERDAQTAEIAGLNEQVRFLKARIAELETPPVVIPAQIGALPLGSAAYPLGAQSVIVKNSTELATALNNHKPGDTISMRAGTYKVPGFGDSFTKGKGAFILQNYPGEAVKVIPADGSVKGFMIVKAPGVVMRGFQLDGFTGNWGGNYGTLILADDPGDGSSASGLLLENMHITNSTSFGVRAFGNRTRRLTGATVRFSTLDGSNAKQILSTDWTDKFTAESSIIRNANKSGAAFDNSEMAAWKDTVSTGLVANRLIIENPRNSVAIWLDQSCVDAAITNIDIIGKTQYGVHIELCGWCVVANVKINGDTKFAFYNKGSRNIRFWGNSFQGAAQVVFMEEQDDRAGKTSATDSRQPWIARGLDYFSRDNEWVNNTSSSDAVMFARMMIYDDQGKTDARTMVSRIAGNVLPVRASGSTASVQLGTPVRRDYSIAALQALDTKFYGNSDGAKPVSRVTVPAEIAKLTDR